MSTWSNIIAQWPLRKGGYLQARVMISTDFVREYEKTGIFGYFRYVIKRARPGRILRILCSLLHSVAPGQAVAEQSNSSEGEGHIPRVERRL